jgi:hypothetical protein
MNTSKLSENESIANTQFQMHLRPVPLEAGGGHGDLSGLATPRKQSRQRRPLPPQEARDWLTPQETALVLGCSIATVHRLRRGLIPGIEPLPCSQYGRKCIFRKPSIARWQDQTENRGLA